jgi:hypothetical protein
MLRALWLNAADMIKVGFVVEWLKADPNFQRATHAPQLFLLESAHYARSSGSAIRLLPLALRFLISFKQSRCGMWRM